MRIIASALLILIFCRRSSSQEFNLFACAEYNSTMPIDVMGYGGLWYEVLRLPSSNAGICVNMLAPNETNDKGEYQVEFNYVDNFTDGKFRVPVHEVITFPWNTEIQAGIFELQYGEVKAIFKLLPLPITDVAVVCGYAVVPGALPLFKLFSRQKELNANVKQQIQLLVEAYNISEHVTWVEQYECSDGVMKPSSFSTMLIMLGTIIYSITLESI